MSDTPVDPAPAWLRPAPVAALMLATGLALFYGVRGPVRGAISDVLIIVFLDACLAAVRIGTPTARLVGVGVIAVVAECVQALHLVGPDAPAILHLTVGATFDPYDFGWYAVGLGIATGLERRWRAGGSNLPAR